MAGATASKALQSCDASGGGGRQSSDCVDGDHTQAVLKGESAGQVTLTGADVEYEVGSRLARHGGHYFGQRVDLVRVSPQSKHEGRSGRASCCFFKLTPSASARVSAGVQAQSVGPSRLSTVCMADSDAAVWTKATRLGGQPSSVCPPGTSASFEDGREASASSQPGSTNSL